MEKALYLYCLAAETLMPSDVQSLGLESGTDVFIHDVAGVLAVVCEVPVEDYCGASAESRLSDLNWVAPRAVKHQNVIERVMTRTSVLPARFGTLFSTRDSLSLLVEMNREKIRGFFEWVRARKEWAVKVRLSRSELRERLMAQELLAQSEALDGLSKGMRYFRERQIRASIDTQIAAKLKTILTNSGREFSDIAVASRRRDVVLRTETDGAWETIANWAFLIDSSREQEFEDRVEAANMRAEGLCVSYQMTGPWPPYSFTPLLDSEVQE